MQRRAGATRCWRLDWTAGAPSASFHGRSLFAHATARLARGKSPTVRLRQDSPGRRADWPDDLPEVAYVDHFGNAMTGLRAATLPAGAKLVAASRMVERARTFGDRPPGAAFWYENSNGLAETAVNLGGADRDIGLWIGTPVEIVS